ncbi:MAG TPA: hypothetical protein VKJ65_09155, partial [Phycisphaerae bacterium]|nr:hypothetical protein [Phycisphaerae bacterium]
GLSFNKAAGIFRICLNRHNMSENVGFADGHAASIPLASLWALQWIPIPPSPEGKSQILQAQ